MKANGLNTLSSKPGGRDKDSALRTTVYLSSKGNAITNSVLVSPTLRKRHKNFLRVVDRVIDQCDPEFSRLNFAPSTYTDRRGKKQRLVLMTRAGFLLVVMSLTGDEYTPVKQRITEQFDRLEAELRDRINQPPPLRLADLTQREVQVNSTKQAASRILSTSSGKYALIRHHRGVMQALTGMTPTEYVKWAVANGLRVASYSGRELLRRLDPARAATAAFFDDQLVRGKSLQQLKASRLHEVLPHAFAAMLACGITPTELSTNTNNGEGQP